MTEIQEINSCKEISNLYLLLFFFYYYLVFSYIKIAQLSYTHLTATQI